MRKSTLLAWRVLDAAHNIVYVCSLTGLNPKVILINTAGMKTDLLNRIVYSLIAHIKYKNCDEKPSPQ